MQPCLTVTECSSLWLPAQNCYGHVETSAKDGDGVAAAITAITALVIEQLRESGRMEARMQASAAAAKTSKR